MTWILDLDGVVWHGDRLIDGSGDAIATLRRRGIRVAFVTNNSNLGAGALVEKFATLGIEVDPDDVLSAHEILVERIGTGKKVISLTGRGMIDRLRSTGNEVLEPRNFIGAEGIGDSILDIPDVDAVVGGLHFDLDYRQLSVAVRALLQCRTLFAANRDPLYPSTSGMTMGTGSIVAALETATSVQATVIGKPEQSMVDALHQRFPDAELVVGDQFAVDGLFARRAGVPFGHVRSGVDGSRQTAATDVPFAHQSKDLAELVAAWG